jgi:hypothetical protein
MIQLKSAAEVAVVRTRILATQEFKCAVCGCSLKGKVRGGATLDHDHSTGVVRGVLCRVCNTGEGKLRTVAVRFGGGLSGYLAWMRAMLGYLSMHKTSRTTYLYPAVKKRAKRGTK